MNIFFVNNLTALFYNSIIFFTLVVTVYEGRCWPINKYFDPVSCSADERAADGMEAMLTRKGESVGLGECKRWLWNNSPFFWIFFALHAYLFDKFHSCSVTLHSFRIIC